MNVIKAVVKKVGAPAYIANVEDDIDAWQAIVEGHCQTITVGGEGGSRIEIVCNEDAALSVNSHPKWNRTEPMPVNFVIPGGHTIRGPMFITKVDGRGSMQSFDEHEANHWRDTLDCVDTSTETDAQKNETPDAIDSMTALSDSCLLFLLPTDATDDAGDILSPEDQIESIAEQFDYKYRAITPSNQTVYGMALARMDSQGFEYAIIDEGQMLLSIPARNLAGENIRLEKYLRIIELEELCNASNQPVTPS